MSTYQLSTAKIPRREYTIQTVSTLQPLSWLKRGWRDFVARPGIGLLYGLLVTSIGIAMTFGLNSLGLYYLVPILSAGFLLVAPLFAVGLYADAKQRQNPTAIQAEKTGRMLHRNMGGITEMGIILMLIFLNWIMLSNLMLAGVFKQQLPLWGGEMGSLDILTSNLPFLGVYIGLGAFLAALVFRMCVVSIPMMVDQNIDVFNAIFLSWKASGENSRSMTLWAVLIVALCMVGFLTLFIGFTLVIPVLGYASWHAYRDILV